MPESIQAGASDIQPDDAERTAVKARIAEHIETLRLREKGPLRQQAYVGLLQESQSPVLTDPEERMKAREYIRAYYSDPDNSVLHQAYVADMKDALLAPSPTTILHYADIAERDLVLRPLAIERILEEAPHNGKSHHKRPLEVVRSFTEPGSPVYEQTLLIEARHRMEINKRVVIYFGDDSEGRQRIGKEFLADAAAPGLRADERIDGYRSAALYLSPESPDIEKAAQGYDASVATLVNLKARVAAHMETIRIVGWDNPLVRRISLDVPDAEPSSGKSALLEPVRSGVSWVMEKGRNLFRHEQ